MSVSICFCIRQHERRTHHVLDVLERNCVRDIPREHPSVKRRGKSLQGKEERRTVIYDDALRHAYRRVCRHLYGTQMTRREAERAQLSGAVARRIVAYR
jgi:hypothetical protein